MLAPLHRSTVAGSYPKDRSAVGKPERSALRHQFVRAISRKLAPKPQHFLCLGRRIEHRATENRTYFMQTELQRCDHSEIPAAPSYRPKKVLILVRGDGQHSSICRYHVCSDHVVDRQSVFAVQLAPSPSKRESRHPYRWHHSLRSCQPKRLCLPVELS